MSKSIEERINELHDEVQQAVQDHEKNATLYTRRLHVLLTCLRAHEKLLAAERETERRVRWFSDGPVPAGRNELALQAVARYVAHHGFNLTLARLGWMSRALRQYVMHGLGLRWEEVLTDILVSRKHTPQLTATADNGFFSLEFPVTIDRPAWAKYTDGIWQPTSSAPVGSIQLVRALRHQLADRCRTVLYGPETLINTLTIK